MNLGHLLPGIIAQYGPAAAGLAVMVGTMGFPTPTTPVLLAAGVMARQGLLDPFLLFLFGLSGALLGDCISYSLGKFAGAKIRSTLVKKREKAWRSAQDFFSRHGEMAVLVTRFLLTSLDVPVSLAAGIARFLFWRFLAFSFIGRLLWAALAVTLGFSLSSQALSAIQSYSGGLAILAVLAAGLWIACSLAVNRTRPHPRKSRRDLVV